MVLKRCGYTLHSIGNIDGLHNLICTCHETLRSMGRGGERGRIGRDGPGFLLIQWTAYTYNNIIQFTQ